jgi:outer membrane protein assembly factor BamD (BamD/ComL family)
MRYFVIFFLACFPLMLFPAYTVRDGKIVNKDFLPSVSPQEHYQGMIAANDKQDWKEVIRQSMILKKHFDATPFVQEAPFFLGISYFHLEDYELANKYLSAYLSRQVTPKYFEEVIQYKYAIAEKFHQGKKKHLFGVESMPKWLPATEEALALYDEVITALPHHDLAAKSYFSKAQLLLDSDDYKAAIEAYQTLIRRFPKHPLAIESYIGIGKVYLKQCRDEYPDPDFLDLAEINLRKFKESFPGEEKYLTAEATLMRMRERYAKNLFETAQFYQRTKKSQAATLYYRKIMQKYPGTFAAQESEKRLASFQ